jgi:hypothetical protein
MPIRYTSKFRQPLNAVKLRISRIGTDNHKTAEDIFSKRTGPNLSAAVLPLEEEQILMDGLHGIESVCKAVAHIAPSPEQQWRDCSGTK